ESLARAARSQCRVVVVRGAVEAEGPIALGHHPSAHEVVARAGDPATAYGQDIELIVRAAATPERAQELLAQGRGQLGSTHPSVYVRSVTIAATKSARELVAASEGASMTVVAEIGRAHV